MSNTLLSPNMNLPIPVTSVDPGPDYANNINACLLTLDSHNHSSGSGIPIPPSGLNISADLTFQGNAATNVSALALKAQSSTPAYTAAVYSSGVDLYYVDGNGNPIRLTASGSVAGTNGSISGLSAPASASYNSGTATFAWQSASATPANMDMGSATIRPVAASAQGITLTAPGGLAASYSLTLPTGLPSAQSLLSVSTAGILSNSPLTSNLQFNSGSLDLGATPTVATSLTVGTGGATLTSANSKTLLMNSQAVITGVQQATNGMSIVAGYINTTTGTGSGLGYTYSWSGAVCTVTWGTAFRTAPVVVLSPFASAGLALNQFVPSTTGATVQTTTTGGSPTAYTFWFIAIGEKA